jgi:CheY-like chemotaxis protein
MEGKLLTTIFYADDDTDDLDFFKEVTKEMDEPVSLFDHSEQLLQTLRNPPPKASVIFLDLNMPVKSGFEVLYEIKSTPSIRHIPIIILTTSSNPTDISKCRKLGANLYIKKPTTVNALKKAVHFVLETNWEKFIPSDKEFVYKY